jgi:hypothetical protein
VRPKPVLAQALPQRWSHRPQLQARPQARRVWVTGRPNWEALMALRAEVSPEAPAAWTEQAEHRRLGRRLREEAVAQVRRVRREPKEPAHSAVARQ